MKHDPGLHRALLLNRKGRHQLRAAQPPRIG